MTLEESLETTKIYSVAGQLPSNVPLITYRPFRSPHHNVSDAGLIGGGAIPKPGEISLSHNGVLFLDELTEFRKNVLELLRQPLEEGELTIARSAVSLTFPARMMFVGAMNPCPCGYLGDPSRSCMCSPLQIQRYRGKLSGPLIDRIDLHVEVPRVPYRDLAGHDAEGMCSMEIQDRVCRARAIQRARFLGFPFSCNSQMGPREMSRYCHVGQEGMNLLERAVEGLGFSARAYSRILKVARSIADLDGTDTVATHHIAEAIQYRVLDRQDGVIHL
jgi:magnesium chelatase family protein